MSLGHRFNAGDRVRCTHPSKTYAGLLGTVTLVRFADGPCPALRVRIDGEAGESSWAAGWWEPYGEAAALEEKAMTAAFARE